MEARVEWIQGRSQYSKSDSVTPLSIDIGGNAQNKVVIEDSTIINKKMIISYHGITLDDELLVLLLLLYGGIHTYVYVNSQWNYSYM